MQVPISQTVRKWMHAVTRKFVTEILVSSLATLLVMTFFPNLTKPAYLFTHDDALLTSTSKSLAAGESSDALDDFMEHVALSHISGLKTPPVAASQEAIVAVNEPTTDTGAPLPPLAAAAPRHERASSSKVHVASVAKVLPPLPPIAVIEPAAGPAPAVIEPAVVTASTKAEVPLVAPLQYGMHLVSNLGTIISVSQTRVVESVASVGDVLTSLAKTSLNKKL
jgi:hypothetical protein